MEDEVEGHEESRAEILQTGRRVIYFRREKERPAVEKRRKKNLQRRKDSGLFSVLH